MVACPSGILGHLRDGGTCHGGHGALKAAPLLRTFAVMVTATVLAAPIIPDAAWIAFMLEGHAHVSPLLVIKLAWVHPLQQLDQIHLLCGRHLFVLQEINRDIYGLTERR